jgi:hypothetical protein
MGEGIIMPPIDPIERIKQQRLEQANQATEQGRTDSIIDAVQGAGSQTTDALSKSMHDILMATMIGKDPRIAEVATNLTELLKSIVIATNNLEDSGLSEIRETFTSLLNELSSLPDRVAETDKSGELIPYLEDVRDAIKAIKVNPSITVSPSKIDLSGLEKTLKEVLQTPEAKGIDLLQYKAQDVNNDDPNIQYVGFIDTEGGWYIIENNGESLRYKFGKKGYTSAFKDAAKLNYKLYSEAVREVQA